ncbi:MAG: HNH endonuclease [Planctomycetes bacterium]|nr:HNH endonuclease [Planctomycetota bacterium]
MRAQVLELVPIWQTLRSLGSALLPHEIASSARKRVLHYFQKYARTVISQYEVEVVAGIGEWARRVRELRTERGWSILSGKAIREMMDAGDLEGGDVPGLGKMGPDDYVMLSAEQDREAALRWKVANEIRRSKGGAKAHILDYLRQNVGRPVSGDELRYVTGNKKEWARRVRELRTEEGWPISTYWNGRPELKSGLYMLEEDRQMPVHDRTISDDVRRRVLVRDRFVCQAKGCGWNRDQWIKEDPRHLELHHIEHHARGGANEDGNLVTLCNRCHDHAHRK